MRQNVVAKGPKTVYCADADLWRRFIERAIEERVSVSSLLEQAMKEFLAR